MYHRGFIFGRLVMFLLFIGGLMAVGRGLYRSGYEQGFVQGMVFAGTDGEAVPGPGAIPQVFGGPTVGGYRPFHGAGFLGFVYVVIIGVMIMKGFGRRHWAHAGPHSPGGWGQHGHAGHYGFGHRHGHHHYGKSAPGGRCRPPSDDIGPEKQPEDIL